MKNILNFRVVFIMFTVVMFALAISVNYAGAKPPGIKGDPEAGKMLNKFNVILLPEGSNWGQSNASCNGSRIFFQESNGNTMGNIEWDFTPGAQRDFVVSDCDGTDDRLAVIDVDGAYEILVYVRVHGKAGHYIQLTCDNVIEDPDNPGNDLCLIDTETIGKGKSFTKVMNNLAEDDYEEVLWSWDGDWKIFEVRIYEWLRD
jgi:hypothetical protein